MSYTFIPGVRWLRDGMRVLVCHEAQGVRLFMDGPEATLWDLLARQRPHDELVASFCAIHHTDNRACTEQLIALTHKLQQAGLLLAEDNDG